MFGCEGFICKVAGEEAEIEIVEDVDDAEWEGCEEEHADELGVEFPGEADAKAHEN